jgi:hypothetical protein
VVVRAKERESVCVCAREEGYTHLNNVWPVVVAAYIDDLMWLIWWTDGNRCAALAGTGRLAAHTRIASTTATVGHQVEQQDRQHGCCHEIMHVGGGVGGELKIHRS